MIMLKSMVITGHNVFFNFGGILGGLFELQPVFYSSNHQNYQNKITLGKNHVKLTNISLNVLFDFSKIVECLQLEMISKSLKNQNRSWI